MTRVSLSFDAWKDMHVSPAVVEVPMYHPQAVESPQLLATLKAGDSVQHVSVSPDGKTLASTCAGSNTIHLWNLADRKECAALKIEQAEYPHSAFSPDGKTLAVAYWKSKTTNDKRRTYTGGLELWDLATRQCRSVLGSRDHAVTQATWSPDGKLLAAEEFWMEGEKEVKRSVTVWDVAGDKRVDTIPDEAPMSMIWSPDGKILLRAAYVVKDRRIESCEIRRRDVARKQDLPPLVNTVNKNLIYYLSGSPDGGTITGVDYSGNIYVWDAKKAVLRSTPRSDSKQRIYAASFSPDGRLMAMALSDRAGRDHEPGRVVVWETASGRELASLTGHKSEVYTVAFGPDGRTLVSGGRDGTIRLWDIRDLRAERPTNGTK
jgi:WD40 repeat protein